jgi:hypothetical protein
LSKEANISQTTHPFIEHIGTSSKAIETARDRVSYYVKSKIEWTGALDLLPILETPVYFSSADPRDLVYAFVGLNKPLETISPDYCKENNIYHVLVAAAKTLLASEHMLTILDNALIRDRPLENACVSLRGLQTTLALLPLNQIINGMAPDRHILQ